MYGATELQTETFHRVKCPRGDRPDAVGVEEVCTKCGFFGGFAARDSMWCFYLKKHNDEEWIAHRRKHGGLWGARFPKEWERGCNGKKVKHE